MAFWLVTMKQQVWAVFLLCQVPREQHILLWCWSNSFVWHVYWFVNIPVRKRLNFEPIQIGIWYITQSFRNDTGHRYHFSLHRVRRGNIPFSWKYLLLFNFKRSKNLLTMFKHFVTVTTTSPSSPHKLLHGIHKLHWHHYN